MLKKEEYVNPCDKEDSKLGCLQGVDVAEGRQWQGLQDLRMLGTSAEDRTGTQDGWVLGTGIWLHFSEGVEGSTAITEVSAKKVVMLI